MRKYNDILQTKIDARVGKCIAYNFNHEQLIGLLMLEDNLFYDEAKARWNQSVKEIKKLNHIK